MPERSQKRKLRSEQSTSQIDEEVASSTNDENTLLSDRDFEDISNKIENKISKRLKDTELNQREILKLIENLSSKVDNLSSTSPERGCSTNRVANNGNSADEVEEVDFGRSEYSNSTEEEKCTFACYLNSIKWFLYWSSILDLFMVILT